jgi:hypothetical protein
MTDNFFFDLHVHSTYSLDSLLKSKSIVKLSTLRRLDAIAITDHDTIKGGVETKKIAPDSLMVITGSEIKTDHGDLIGLFLNEEIKSRSFPEVIDEIKDQDGIVILPHPFRRKVFPTEAMLKKVDVFEGLNGRTSAKLNQKAIDLANEFNKPTVAGSDSHFSYELGRFFNCTEFNCSDEEELRDVILKQNLRLVGKQDSKIIRKGCIYSSYLLKKYQSRRIY